MSLDDSTKDKIEQRLTEINKELNSVKKIRLIKELCIEIGDPESSLLFAVLSESLQATSKILKSNCARGIKYNPLLENELKEIYQIANSRRNTDYLLDYNEEKEK